MSPLGRLHKTLNRARRGASYILQFAYAIRVAARRWIDAPRAMLAEALAQAWAKGLAERRLACPV